MKLKKKFMLNYEGEDWVCLSDFNEIKRKLKKTLKEKAKLESFCRNERKTHKIKEVFK